MWSSPLGFPGADNVLPFCDNAWSVASGGDVSGLVVRAAVALGLPELIRDLGGDPASIFKEARLDPAVLNHPDRYMPPRPFQAALNVAARRLNRPDFGLLFGQRTDLSILGPLYIALMNAENGRAAIELAVRYLHTQTQVVALSIASLPGGAHEQITMHHAQRDKQWLAQNLERNIVVLHRVLSESAGRAYWPSEILFEHKRLAPLNVYQRILGIAPDFGRDTTAIVLERAMLDAVRPGRNGQLRTMAEAYLNSLGPPARTAFAVETANMIRILCRSSDCSAADTARALGMHERTLQRRLQAEGTSFDQIKDSVRREMAEQYLADPTLPITQIAFMLHYANSSAFTRACRRWFGKPPSAVRKSLIASAA